MNIPEIRTALTTTDNASGAPLSIRLATIAVEKPLSAEALNDAVHDEYDELTTSAIVEVDQAVADVVTQLSAVATATPREPFVERMRGLPHGEVRSAAQLEILADYRADPTESRQFLIDFVMHPERFEPTAAAVTSAYADFVVRRFDESDLPSHKRVLPSEIDFENVDTNRIRNVHVEVRMSDHLDREVAVVVSAEVRDDSSSNWESTSRSSVRFRLDDWVQRNG